MPNTFRNLIDAKTLVLPLVLAVLLVFCSWVSFLLFHTLAEFFAIVIAVLAAVVAWQMYAFTRNHFLMYLGCGYFWIAALDMIHAITYKGLSILPVSGSGITSQLWIGTRYLEALLLLTAPWFLAHSFKRNLVILLYGLIAITFVILIMLGHFPLTFIEGQGLTKFKINSEYTIITILALAIYYLGRQRRLMDQRVFSLMIASIALTMMAELAFTFYVDLYGLSNLAGHIFKLFSFWLVFVAVVQTTLRDPFSAMSKAETYYDAVPDATIIVNKEGVIEHVNKPACLLANQSAVELVGKHAHSVFHNINTIQKDCPVCQSIANGTELSAYELQISATSWFDFSISVIQGETRFIEVIRNITDKKRTAASLEENEANLTITLNSIGDAVIATDVEGNVTRMNPVAELLTGWSLQLAQGRPLKSIFPIANASTREPIEDPVKQVMTTGKTVNLSNNTTLTAKDGTEYQIADSAAPIRDGDGEIQGMVLVFNDVTEQYQLRELAAESKRDLQAIMDNSPAVVYVKDTTGRFTFINRQFEKLFHIKREDIIGQALHDIFPKDIADEMQCNDKAVLEAGHALESEEAAPQDDGLHTYVSIKFPLYNEKGNANAVCGISTDITQRKKMEDDIRSSMQHLRLYREQAPLGGIEWDSDFRVVDWNAAAEEIFGYTFDEVKGRNPLEFLIPENVVVDIKQIWNTLITQTAGKASVNENLTKDDRTILCEWHNTPLRDESGNVIGVASIVQDISERYQAEQSLKRVNRSLQTLSACNEVLVRAVDEEELLNKVCRIIVEITGYRLAWVGFAEHDEAKTIRPMAQAGNTGDYLNTGKLTWVDTERGQEPMGTAIRTGILSIIHNLKENPRYSEFVDSSLGQEYHSSIALPLKDKEQTFGALNIYAREEDAFDEDEIRLLQELANDLAYGIVTLRSHRERHQLNKQLQQAQKMESIGQLTGGIAHDFNNILASILGFTNLALQRFVGDDQPKLRDYLNQVTHAGERARDLVSQMLAFSRTGSSKPTPLQLSPMIKEVTNMLQATLPSSIELSSQIDADVPAVVMDPVNMQQVLMNMCINARDAIGDKGCIDIRARCVHINHSEQLTMQTPPYDTELRNICDACHNQIEAGDYVELSVQDTGSGISDDKLKQIFEPFFTTKEVGKGTGMGLSMVHGIVHKHGGHILVDTQLSVGTTFRLLFPVGRDEPIQGPDIELNTTSVTEGLNNERILVVDDEESVAMFIGDLIESRGGNVTVMTDSLAALDLFSQDPMAFDLVITDQTMPGLTGAELAQKLLALRPELPMILCTGYSEQVNEKKAKALGIRGYIAKPMESNTLLNLVQSLIV